MLPRTLLFTLLLLPALAGAQASYSTADRDRMIIGAAQTAVAQLGPNPYRMYTSAWSHEEDRRLQVYEAAMRRESDRLFKIQVDAARAKDHAAREEFRRKNAEKRALSQNSRP